MTRKKKRRRKRGNRTAAAAAAAAAAAEYECMKQNFTEWVFLQLVKVIVEKMKKVVFY